MKKWAAKTVKFNTIMDLVNWYTLFETKEI